MFGIKIEDYMASLAPSQLLGKKSIFIYSENSLKNPKIPKKIEKLNLKKMINNRKKIIKIVI